MFETLKPNDGVYRYVAEFYQGSNEVASTGVPKINHIDEGLAILEYLEADIYTLEAWCLHPLLQGDRELIDCGKRAIRGATKYSIVLAMEYRATANAYLCTPETDHFTQDDMPKIVLPEVKLMLIADKISNANNLDLHNRDHKRYKALAEYFKKWMIYLDVSMSDYRKLVEIISKEDK